jgi:hypothetical protein
LKCIFSNFRTIFEVTRFLFISVGGIGVVVPVGLEQFGKLGYCFFCTEPFHFDGKSIDTVIMVLSDNGGTSSSTIALRKFVFSIPEPAVVEFDSPFEQDLYSPRVSSRRCFSLRAVSSNLETRLETLTAPTLARIANKPDCSSRRAMKTRQFASLFAKPSHA